MNFYVGTSGYSYKEWKGPFYPEDLPDKQMLHARAVTGLNFVTKRIITLPANLAFSSTTQADKAVYALTVDCK